MYTCTFKVPSSVTKKITKLKFISSSLIYFYLSKSNNTIPATSFKQIAAPRKQGEREENETERGLRIADKGFLNTAVITSEITYIDGEAGGM